MIDHTPGVVLTLYLVAWSVLVLRTLLRISDKLNEVVAEIKADLRLRISSNSSTSFRMTASVPRIVEIRSDDAAGVNDAR